MFSEKQNIRAKFLICLYLDFRIGSSLEYITVKERAGMYGKVRK